MYLCLTFLYYTALDDHSPVFILILVVLVFFILFYILFYFSAEQNSNSISIQMSNFMIFIP